MPDCCRCRERALYVTRVAIPIKGTKTIDRWIYTSTYVCEAHRRTLKPDDILTSDDKAYIATCMKAKEPDFERAYLEWMRV